jgi:hypothetical protein
MDDPIIKYNTAREYFVLYKSDRANNVRICSVLPLGCIQVVQAAVVDRLS